LHLLMDMDITMNYSGSVWIGHFSTVAFDWYLVWRGIRTIYAQNLNGCGEWSLTVKLLVAENG
jgi:hypothetical protein